MSAHRPIRFAVQMSGADSAAGWSSTALRHESAGFDTISMPDHLWNQFGPVSALAFLAAATSKVRLATTVLCNDYRHPAVVAKELATIDLLSGGRLELGLGAGWAAHEYDEVGLSFDTPGTRISRLAESVAIIRRLFSGAPVTFDGEFYQLRDHTLSPLSPASACPPVMIGGGSRRILELAAREADVVSIIGSTRGKVERTRHETATADAALRSVETLRAAAGDRFDKIELNIRLLVVAIGPDRRSLAAKLAATTGLDEEQLLASPFFALGTIRQIVDQFLRVREELGVSYYTVSSGHAHDIDPVIEALTA